MFNIVLAALLLPLIAVILVWRRPARSGAGWIANLLLALGMVGFSYFVAPWATIGMPLRYVLPALLLAAIVVSIRRRPDPELKGDPPVRIMVKLLIAFFFAQVAIVALRGRQVPHGAVDVAFPLARGTYGVVHGGSSMAANTYYGRGATAFAVEVVKSDGPIANATVVSPCDGVSSAAGGSTMRVLCNGVTVDVAPVKPPKIGPVRRGEPIAAAEGPTLRIHGERKGGPVPLTFDGRWLVRNAVLRR